MKVQIRRFEPHQNAKVFAVLTAIGSMVFFVPMMLWMSIAAPPEQRPPLMMLVLMPLLYLVVGYLSVAVGSWLYNLMFPRLGGIEFDTTEVER